METKLDQLLSVVTKIAEDISSVKGDLKNVKEKQDEHSKGLAAIQNLTMENNKFVHAVSQDIARTATKQSIDSLDAKFNLMNDRLFQTETKVSLLAVAK